MRKNVIIFLATAIAVANSAIPAKADEGMWLLPLIEKMNIRDMRQEGCRLSAKQIYDVNNSSLKDAIVQFGGGCTGEIVSDQGLLLTNHHCGYSSIQKLSSVEHNYLQDGYWAMNRGEELPVEGLTVTFLESLKDVTAELAKAEKRLRAKYDGEEGSLEKYVQDQMIEKRKEMAVAAEKQNPHCHAEVVSYYNENVWYLILYKTFEDIRFVGAPPSSIGKFGADTDNWMWPRHTGDFSIFRVYADAENNPAPYSADNVPYTPKQHLSISLKGIKEGDFTMIMGYPGRTMRFQTSPELEFMLEQNDIRIAARTVRQELMMEDMLADPAVRIQYSNKYARSSNGWKKWQGMRLAFDKLDIIGRAEQEEEAFMAWVAEDIRREDKYAGVMEDIRRGLAVGYDANILSTIASESVMNIELSSFAGRFKASFRKALREGSDTTKALQAAFDALKPLYADYSVATDKKIAAAMLEFFRDNAAQSQWLKGLSDKPFGEMDFNSYVDGLFASSAFVGASELEGGLAWKGAGLLTSDPAMALYESIMDIVENCRGPVRMSQNQLAKARKLYTAAMLDWKHGEPSYPDANFTMRLTYGTVKGYSPKDAVIYRYYTTLDGVMEKEDPDNWEFVVPQKLKDLYAEQDYGRYALPDGKLPVAFLSNNDITGGNSGSPVLNAYGELLGLAFDGNWESMSSDVMFEPELQRCINVDIRYVLFIIDKFGGAGWLLDEMTINQL